MRSLLKESTRTIIYQVGGLLLTALTGMITARLLGPADRGISALILLYPSLLHVLGHLSIGLALLHHLGKKEYALSEYPGSLSLMAIAAATTLTILFSASGLFFREALYSDLNLGYLALALTAVPFTLLLYYFSSLLQGLIDIQWYNFSNLVPKALAFLLIATLALRGRLTVLDAVLVATISHICAGLLSVFRARKVIPEQWSVNWRLISTLLRDGSKIHVGAVAVFMFSQGNMFIIAHYLSEDQLGFYYLAYTLASLLLLISTSVETVLYPTVSSSPMDDALVLVNKACRQVLFLTLSVTLVFAMASKYIVSLYGGKAFLPAVKPLLLLLPGMAALVIPKVLAPLWVRKGWFSFLTYTALGAAILNIALNLVLVPWFGISGAALGNTLTYFFIAGFSLVAYWKFVGSELRSLLLIQPSDWATYRDLLYRLGGTFGG